MGITIGPVDWWVATPDGIDSMAISCPLGTILPDKSAVICRAGGVAWIVAPATTQVIESWAGGQYNTTLVGDKCCVSEWSSLCSALVSAGFNPGDWFVPCYQLLQNPGYVCRTIGTLSPSPAIGLLRSLVLRMLTVLAILVVVVRAATSLRRAPAASVPSGV